MQIKEEKGNNICLKHNQVIELIVMDKQIQPADSMLCFTCVKLNRQPLNQVVGIDQAKEMIREKLASQSEGLEEGINKQFEILREVQQNMIELRQQLLMNIDTITRMIESWSNELKIYLGKKESIDLMLGIQLFKEDQRYAENLMKQNNKTYLMKIDSVFQRLMTMDRFQKCHQELKKLDTNDVSILKPKKQISTKTPLIQEKQLCSISCQIINKVAQEENSNAMAFNNSGSIMIAGFKENIKVWQFDQGKMKELILLKGGGDWISYLIFSKKTQWFFSGDFSGNIQCWKQGQNTSEWANQKAQNLHKQPVRCIILTKNEDQILSSGLDNQIYVWEVKYLQNQIFYHYTLENKHTNAVLGLSLNPSETALVSCGFDKQLILWTKGLNDRWQFQNSVNLNLGLIRVCFINENQILIQQDGQGFTNVFLLKNQQLKEQDQLQIPLQIPNDNFDCPLFPTLYNKCNNVIIQKSKKYVLIIRQHPNDQFKIETQPIDCETDKNYGTLTEDGQYLVIWNDKTKEFRVHKIQYGK